MANNKAKVLVKELKKPTMLAIHKFGGKKIIKIAKKENKKVEHMINCARLFLMNSQLFVNCTFKTPSKSIGTSNKRRTHSEGVNHQKHFFPSSMF
jgi:hypothetical protein